MQEQGRDHLSAQKGLSRGLCTTGVNSWRIWSCLLSRRQNNMYNGVWKTNITCLWWSFVTHEVLDHGGIFLLWNRMLHAQSLSRVWLFVTAWTVACQAPLFMGFPRQEFWSGLPFPSQGNLLSPDVEPVSLVCPTLAGRFHHCYLGNHLIKTSIRLD